MTNPDQYKSEEQRTDEVPAAPSWRVALYLTNAKAYKDKCQAAVRRQFEYSKRYICGLVRDFRYRLRKATFVVEVIGVMVVGIYAYEAWRANNLVSTNLEITERAYLNLGPVQPDYVKGVLIFPIENSGKLPGVDPLIKGGVMREHWPDGRVIDYAPIDSQQYYRAVPPGKGYGAVVIDLNKWSPSEEQEIRKSAETIIVATVLQYGDGLGKTVTDYPFCAETQYNAMTGNIGWVSCVLGTFEALMRDAEIAKQQHQPNLQEPNAKPNTQPSSLTPVR